MFVCSIKLIYPIVNLGYTVQGWLLAPMSPHVYTQPPSALWTWRKSQGLNCLCWSTKDSNLYTITDYQQLCSADHEEPHRHDVVGSKPHCRTAEYYICFFVGGINKISQKLGFHLCPKVFLGFCLENWIFIEKTITWALKDSVCISQTGSWVLLLTVCSSTCWPRLVQNGTWIHKLTRHVCYTYYRWNGQAKCAVA